MSNKFIVGGIVRLKSGGPKMTIEEVDVHKGELKCVWFDKTDNVEANYFLFEIVELLSKGNINAGPFVV